MHLLEREQHLAQLDEHLRHAAAGHGRMVFVCGEAGVGKTSLVDAFCRDIPDAAQVVWKSCDALSTPGPLGSLRDVAPVLGLDVNPEAITAEDRDWLFRAALDALTSCPGTAILVGEDAHWADGVTLELLRFLARRIQQRRILVLVTYRDDEIGAQHPLRVLLGDLATSAAVFRLPVSPLSADAVACLATGSGRDAATLHQLTGGNPFYLTEVLATEGETIPASVEDAVLARAARLAPAARAMLDVAAVIATKIYPELLTGITGQPIHEHCDACVAGGLLRIAGDDLAFRHEITRKAIMAAIPPPRRRQIHALVLARLREQPQPEPDLALLAHHAEGAGDGAAALTFATAAAEQARSLFAHREAAAQYARALRFAADLPVAERARLLDARSLACYYSDQVADAVAARQAALSLWRAAGNPLREGEALRWLSRLQWVAGDGGAAATTGRAAIAVLEQSPPGPELAMAYSNYAQLCMLAHDLDGALHWGQLAITLGERCQETETIIHALANVGTAQQLAGRAAGEAALWRSLELARTHGYLDHACRALTNLAWGALVRLDLAAAATRLADGIAFATEHDLDTYLRYLLATRALLRLRRGEWDEALQETAALLAQPSLSCSRLVALTVRGLILARRGEAESAALLDEALHLAERARELQRLAPVRLARAEAAQLAGDSPRALAEVRAVRDLIVARGDSWQRGEAAWLCHQAGVQEFPLNHLALPYARQIAGEFAEAAAAWHALGLPYEAAVAALHTSDPARIAEAVAALEQLGAHPTLAWARRDLRARRISCHHPPRRGPNRATRANPAGLTQRELEVLELVVTGLRNADIAERLFLTSKTVGHHISAIYAKLGVANRAEAVHAAARLGVSAA